MNPIKEILNRYDYEINDQTTKNKIKFDIARRMNTTLENVKVEYNDQNYITNVTVSKKSSPQPIHIMGKHKPVDFIRGLSFDQVIFDEWDSREVSAESGVLTKEIIDSAFEQSLRSFGTVHYPKTYQADFNNQTEDRTQIKLNELRDRVKQLEDLLYERDQEVEHYKMLALEN